MGRKSNAKRQRRRAARFTVLSPGVLEVLSIGKGDLKIEIGDSNEDRARAQQMIEEMMRKGYTLFVETSDGLEKVKKFLPGEMVYVVADTPDIVADSAEPAHGEDQDKTEPEANGRPASPLRSAKSGYRPRSKTGPGRKVPVAGSKTTAVGRTAGG